MSDRARLSSDVSEIKLTRLATLILLLALGGCAPVATGQGQAPAAAVRTAADIRPAIVRISSGGGGGM